MARKYIKDMPDLVKELGHKRFYQLMLYYN